MVWYNENMFNDPSPTLSKKDILIWLFPLQVYQLEEEINIFTI